MTGSYVLGDDDYRPDRKRRLRTKAIEKYLQHLTVRDLLLTLLVKKFTVAIGCPIGLERIASVSVPMLKVRTMLMTATIDVSSDCH